MPLVRFIAGFEERLKLAPSFLLQENRGVSGPQGQSLPASAVSQANGGHASGGGNGNAKGKGRASGGGRRASNGIGKRRKGKIWWVCCVVFYGPLYGRLFEFYTEGFKKNKYRRGVKRVENAREGY